jgi:hypothetical protein
LSIDGPHKRVKPNQLSEGTPTVFEVITKKKKDTREASSSFREETNSD